MIRNNFRHLYKNIYPQIFYSSRLLPFRNVLNNAINSKYLSTNLQPKLQTVEHNYEIDVDKSRQVIPTQLSENISKNLDNIFYKIDMDVKKSGRIKKSELQSIINEIKSQKYMTSVQALLLIRCCGNLLVEEPLSERRLLTEQAWNLIIKLGIPLDISHYNSLLKLYLENQDFDKVSDPTKFLESIKQKGITTNNATLSNFLEPNRVTYQRIIAIYCELGNMGQAAKMLEYMKGQDMAINEAIFNSLMRGYAIDGDMSSAKDILNIMRQSKLEPTSLSYITLATLYAQNGMIQEMDDVFKEANKNGINFMNKDMIDVIFALVQSQKSKAAQAQSPKAKAELVKDWMSHFVPHLKPHHDFIKNVINLTARLLAAGGTDVEAYEIFKYLTITAGEEFPEFGGINNPLSNSGMFIVKQMCMQTSPKHSFEDLTYICTDMHGTGSNTFAVQKALELAYIHKGANTQRAMACLGLLKQLGLPLRPHYFWPLMARYHGNDRGPGDAKVWDLLHTMKSKFNVPVNFETLVNYVYPLVDGQKRSRPSRVQAPGLVSENLEEAMDEDYEEGKDHSSTTDRLRHLMSNLSPLVTEPLALNSYLYYNIYLANQPPPPGRQGGHLENAHAILTILCGPDSKYGPLVKDLDPRLLLYRLGSAYVNSLKDCETAASSTTTHRPPLPNMMCDILSWVQTRSTNTTSSPENQLQVEDVENVVSQTDTERPLDLASFDWNGKILVDVCNLKDALAAEPLIKAYGSRGLNISESAYSALLPSLKESGLLSPDLDQALISLINPGLSLSLPLDHSREQGLDPSSSSSFNSYRYGDGPFSSQRRPGGVALPLYKDMEAGELENLLTRYENDGSNTLALKRHLLGRYCRSATPNAKRIDELKESLTKDYPSSGFTPGTYSFLIDYYLKSGDVDRALDTKRQAEAFDPLFRTSISKILDMCTLLIQKPDTTSSQQVVSLLDDAAIMPSPPAYDPVPAEEHGSAPGLDEIGRGPGSSSAAQLPPRNNTEFLAWKMLNAAAARPLPDFAKLYEKTVGLLETVLPSNRSYGSRFRPSPSIMGTLVSFHVNTGDLATAVNVFEKFSTDYQVTPNMASILRALIDKNDTEKLQKVVDISSTIHTEINVLIDLLFVFIELGRTKEANKIIETSGFWYKPLRFQHYCNKLVRERKVKELEYLISATKNIRDIDRDQMCYYLLQVNEKENDWQSALNLWTSMQEENVQPSYQTLQLIAEILQRNGQPVPFIMSEMSGSDQHHKTLEKTAQSPKVVRPSQISSPDPFASLGPMNMGKEREMMQFLTSDDVESALKIKNELTSTGYVVSGRVYNSLLEKMIPKDGGMIEKALELGREMKANHVTIPIATLKSLLSRLSLLGMVDSIRDDVPGLLKYPGSVDRLNLEKFISYAYTNSGKASEYLKSFEDTVDEATEQKSSARVPSGLLYMLNKKPELYDRVKGLADKYASKGLYLHQNTLFTYHTLRGEYQIAKDIYLNILKPALAATSGKAQSPMAQGSTEWTGEFKNLNVGIICKDSKLKNDETPLRFLIHELQLDSNFLKGLVYSFLISIKCHNAKYEEALELFTEARDKAKIDISDFKVFALRELKNSLESTGKPVPFQMPQQAERNNFA